MKIDVHQHLWSEPLVNALAERTEHPFVRREHGLTVLYLVGERPYVIDVREEAPHRRASLVEHDGLDRALLSISSPLGIEWLPADQSRALIDAYHEGALSLQGRFGVWGAIPLLAPDPADVDHVLELGCVGLSLPAGALASVDAIAAVHPVLARLELLGAPLLVHPGPCAPRALAPYAPTQETSLGDPLWWPALTHYVAGMQAAWLAFGSAGRPRLPQLRVVFSMLAGLAPLQVERLAARGGPAADSPDPLLFYEISSYGPRAVAALEDLVGRRQLLYGSDRPVLDPAPPGGVLGRLDWDPIVEATHRALDTATRALAVR